MLIESFLKYLRLERNYSEKTILSYGIDLKEFQVFFKEKSEDIDFITLDSDLIRLWIIDLMDRGYTSTSVNRKLSALRSFYRFLLRRGLVEINPTLKVTSLKNKKPLPVFVKEADMDRIIERSNFKEGFEGCRDRLIIEMFYTTGMRLSELIGLKDRDIDFYSSTLTVLGKRNKQRIIPFDVELKRDISEYINVRDEYLTGGNKSGSLFVLKSGEAMYPLKVYNLVKRSLAKFVSIKKKSPHVLRHTFATSMLNNDASLESIKELLGHESLETTQVYTHTTFEELKKIYEQAHPRA